MSNRRRVTAGILLAVVGVAMFELVGAWLFARGLPWWASLTLALVVFPLAPVAWHLLAERKRRRGVASAVAGKPMVKPKAGTLTGGDRYTLRLMAVALVTMGPLLFFRGGQVWRSFKAHPGWFVPASAPGPRTFHGDERLIGQVPADAELVVWARKLDGMAGGDKAARGGDGADDAKELIVAARSGGDVMFVVRGNERALGKLDVAALNAQLAKQGWLPVKGPLVARRRAADVMVVMSEGWAGAADDRAAGRAGGPEAILARLDAAPAQAAVITAAAPAHPVAGVELTAMQAWLRLGEDGVRIDADFFVADREAAAALVARMDAERDEVGRLVAAECRPKVDALLRDLVVVSGDTMVKASAYWRSKAVGEAMMCAVGALMQDADWK
jgi:hypothetical protein